MTDKRKNNILIISVLIVYVAYFTLFLSFSKSEIANYMNVAAIIVLALISILLLGFKIEKFDKIKKAIIGITFTETAFFMVVSYMLGVVTGFKDSSLLTSFGSIMKMAVVPICYIVAMEIFRYTVVQANKDSKAIVYTVTVLIMLLEIAMGIRGTLMYNFETTFRALSTIVIPVIIKNATLTYVAGNSGFISTILYRLIAEMTFVLLPIYPDLGDYLTSVIGILMPTMVYMYSSRLIEDNKEEVEELDYNEPVLISEGTEIKPEKENKKLQLKFLKLSDAPLLIIILILVALISGKFKYSIIGVGSESMQPKIDKGDAVVYEKVESEYDIHVGNIIVFRNGNKMIIHRLVDIKEEGGVKYYITKGDANNGNDNINLTIDNIHGKVVFKIKYIAYPNLWLKDMIDKE